MGLRRLTPTRYEFGRDEFPGVDLIAVLQDNSDSTYVEYDGGVAFRQFYDAADFAGVFRIQMRGRYQGIGGVGSITMELIQWPLLGPGQPVVANIFSYTPGTSSPTDYTFDTNSIPAILDDLSWSGWVYPQGVSGDEVAAAFDQRPQSPEVLFDVQPEWQSGEDASSVRIFTAQVWVDDGTPGDPEPEPPPPMPLDLPSGGWRIGL